MKPLTAKTQVGSYIVFCTVCISLILLSACGSGNRPDTSENIPSDKGSITFSVAWEGTASQSAVHQAARSPSGDVCVDYGIERISADVYNSSNTVVKSASWPCSTPDHEGTISGVRAGSGMYLVVKGTVGGNVDWQGQTATFTVSAGKTTNAGTVTMSYIGTDTTPPDVTSTSPSNGEEGVALDTDIIVTFSEDVVAASVNTSTFTLETDTTPVSGTVIYDSSTKTGTFTPDTSLSEGTDYMVTITTLVQDMGSNQMAEDYTCSFTTEYILDTLVWDNGNWDETVWQ